MENTGERVIPEYMKEDNGMLIEHRARYAFSKKYVLGKVLDIACGVGYGADILLEEIYNERIDHYLGIDRCKDVIAYARRMYGFQQTQFVQGDALDSKLVEKYGEFDTILSFETIEHIKEDQRFVQNLRSLLAEKGRLMISTPIGRGRDKPCNDPFHFRHYQRDEFVDLLENNGFEVELFFQRGKTIEKPEPKNQYYLMVAVCKHKGPCS